MGKVGITRFRFHNLGHTFAIRLIQAGVDVYTVKKLGCWKTISMVLRYAHHDPESLRGGARCWIDCGKTIAQRQHNRVRTRVRMLRKLVKYGGGVPD
jgi:hypothetical protein